MLARRAMMGAAGRAFQPRLASASARPLATMIPAPPEHSLVDASKVFVKNDAYGGAGAYATVAIKSGDVVEQGIVRVLTNCDGNENPYVFTWSEETPNKTWAIGSGCATFYNTAEEADANTHMERDYGNCSFVIVAT
jgi:hypothetical protein